MVWEQRIATVLSRLRNYWTREWGMGGYRKYFRYGNDPLTVIVKRRTGRAKGVGEGRISNRLRSKTVRMLLDRLRNPTGGLEPQREISKA